MSRSVAQVFEEFQKARSNFVQTLADLTQRPQNIDGLRSAGETAGFRSLVLLRAETHGIGLIAESLNAYGSKYLTFVGALRLLRPLLLDLVPGIQQTAAVAVGRLAGHSEEAAAECVREDILPHLVASVAQQNVSLLGTESSRAALRFIIAAHLLKYRIIGLASIVSEMLDFGILLP